MNTGTNAPQLTEKKSARLMYLDPNYRVTLIQLAMVFILGGIAGTILETVWILLSKHQLQWRSPLILCPIHPIYAIGTLLMTLCLRPFLRLKFKHKVFNFAGVFLGAAVIGSGFEYVSSLFQTMMFKSTSWNYHSQKFNLGGRTSLGMALIWGLLGLFWVAFALPWLLELINWMKPSFMHKIAIYCTILFCVTAIISCFTVYQWELRLEVEAGMKHLQYSGFQDFINYLFPDRIMKFFYPSMQFNLHS